MRFGATLQLWFVRKSRFPAMYKRQRLRPLQTFSASHLEPKPPWKLESPSASTSLEFESSPSTSTSTTLFEKELLPPGPLSKGTSVKWLPLLFRIVWIVAPVESRSQLRITEHFIRLIDICHLLCRLLFRDPQRGCLVGVVLLRHCSIGLFNGAVVGVCWDA